MKDTNNIKKTNISSKERLFKFLDEILSEDKSQYDIDFGDDMYDVIINRDETEISTHITIITDNITSVKLYHFQIERGQRYFSIATVNGEEILDKQYNLLNSILTNCGYEF